MDAGKIGDVGEKGLKITESLHSKEQVLVSAHEAGRWCACVVLCCAYVVLYVLCVLNMLYVLYVCTRRSRC
jgi:hypothetical protein